ncbi:hypothetical protein L484_012330 [Morus notabilis]|uniref:Copia protein n=1 Tax=Morus notabilis TaxID=981085 RepID=W9S3D1_9ROSA|nr:hypothetical protein L484_012330 [Morus notabilis]
MAQGICEMIWLKRILEELRRPVIMPMKLYCDNKAAISIVHNPVQHDRTKHVEIDWHFIKEKYAISILQVPAVHKKKPPRSGYHRTKINPSTWEIRDLNTSMGSNMPKCLVTQMLEINSSGWWRWKRSHSSKFEKSVPYALLCQVSGLKEYISANPALKFEVATTVVKSKISHVSPPNGENEEEAQDEFYDAIGGDSSSSDEESDDDEEFDQKEAKVKLRNVSWAIASFALRRTSGISMLNNFDFDFEILHFIFIIKILPLKASSSGWVYECVIQGSILVVSLLLNRVGDIGKVLKGGIGPRGVLPLRGEA